MSALLRVSVLLVVFRAGEVSAQATTLKIGLLMPSSGTYNGQNYKKVCEKARDDMQQKKNILRNYQNIQYYGLIPIFSAVFC